LQATEWTEWSRELERGREEKDEFFAKSHNSPIPHEERGKFGGLKYFAPDPKYSIKTKLRRYESSDIVTMTTSVGTKQKFYRVGYFEFEIGNQKARLQAYSSAEREDKELFVPFKDKTSGKETYAKGRYIDLGLDPNDEYFLDFNFAYNPYCAYSNDYVCPFPPGENWLDVEIRAGEKMYHKD
jgi:uncharacterized protein (DUF1684 family)